MMMMRLLISLLLIGLIACAEQPKGFTFKLRGDFINVDTATVNVLSPEDKVLLSTRTESESDVGCTGYVLAVGL